MARHWNRWSALLGLVLLLQLALSVVSFGEDGECPSYPEDLTWKKSFSARELPNIRQLKKMNLRLEGTFKQGPKVLLPKPESDLDLRQVVKMELRTANPSNSRDVYKVNVILTLGFRSGDASPFFDALGKTSRFSHEAKIFGDGTFNEATGELCVIGCIEEVCKYKLSLKYPAPKTILDVSVEGNLTSIGGTSHGAYFDPVSIHAFADAPFEYTKNATVASVCPSLAPDVKVPKLWNHEDDSEDVCFGLPHMFWQPIEVTWNSTCEGADCSPFAEIGNITGGNITFLQVQRFSCQENRVQANLVFTSSSLPFSFELTDPTASDGTLLAEGIWNFKTRQMCMIACRLYGKQDCEIAVTAQFPLTFTATQRSALIGHVQSLRNEADPLYFKQISFRTFAQGSLQGFVSSGFEGDAIFTNSKNKPDYVYTKVATAKAQCANSNEKKKSSSGNYPSGENWSELELIVVKDLPSPVAKGKPIFNDISVMNIFTRGNEFIQKTFDQVQHKGANVTGLGVVGSAPVYAVKDGIMNVSYLMEYTIGQQRSEIKFGWREQREGIAGEGFYDSNTGKLCLIGCRTVDLKQEGLKQLEGDTHKDCQTFFNIQLPPKDSSQVLKGTVESLRDPDDRLYFLPESFSGFTNKQNSDTSWRIDLEIVLSVLMLSFTVAFLLKQVLYSKRHPETLPYISITMLLLLCLAHMIPLVLDFESLLQNPRIGYHLMEDVGRWPEVNKIVVRFLTLLAMLLQLRLLQLVWKSRTDPNSTPPVQERTMLLYYLTPLYIAGGLIAILPHAVLRFKPYERGFLWRGNQGGMWWDVHAYVGLLVDFHLLPQVMANALWDESASTTTTPQAPPLTKLFFMGAALVRSVPHLYDLCRQFRFIPSFSDMYLYANPEWEFYSVCADVAIPLVVMLLALLVAVQQTFGGRCVLPRRWRSRLEKQEYERVENSIADFAL